MKPIDRLIHAFGGVRAFQRKLGEKHASLIQGWQETDNVPHYREAQIRAAAKKHAIVLPAEMMAAIFPDEEAASRRKRPTTARKEAA